MRGFRVSFLLVFSACLVASGVLSAPDASYCQQRQAECAANCSPPATVQFSCQGTSVSCGCTSGGGQASSMSSGTSSQAGVGSFSSAGFGLGGMAGASAGNLPAAVAMSGVNGLTTSTSSGGVSWPSTLVAAGGQTQGAQGCAAKRRQCELQCGAGRARFFCDEESGSQSVSCSCSSGAADSGARQDVQSAASLGLSQTGANAVAGSLAAAGPSNDVGYSQTCRDRQQTCQESCGGPQFARFNCDEDGSAIASSCSCGAAHLLPLNASLLGVAGAPAPAFSMSASCRFQEAQCEAGCPAPYHPRFHCDDSGAGMAISCSCTSSLADAMSPAGSLQMSKACKQRKRQCEATCPPPARMHFDCDDRDGSMSVSCSCSALQQTSTAQPGTAALAFGEENTCQLKRQACQAQCVAPMRMSFTCDDSTLTPSTTCGCTSGPQTLSTSSQGSTVTVQTNSAGGAVPHLREVGKLASCWPDSEDRLAGSGCRGSWGPATAAPAVRELRLAMDKVLSYLQG